MCRPNAARCTSTAICWRTHLKCCTTRSHLITTTSSTPRPSRRSRRGGAPSCANGGSGAAPWPIAWKRQGIACSVSHTCRTASGNQHERPTPSNGSTRNSNAVSRRKPCCPRLKPRRCSSGRCLPRVRLSCARSMGGRPWPSNHALNALTSQPEAVTSICRWLTNTDFYHSRGSTTHTVETLLMQRIAGIALCS